MAVLNGVKIRAVSKRFPHLKLAYVDGTQETALSKINDRGEKLFWRDFHNMLEHYPELEEILRDEYKRVTACDRI